MRYLPVAIFGIFLISAQGSLPVAITSPLPGSIVAATITVSGTTDVVGFESYVLDFSYASNPTDTWFAIQSSSQPEVDGPLAIWDTTMISDGDYILRLRVFVDNGTFQDAFVPFTILNDAPVPTSTPMSNGNQNLSDNQAPTPFFVAPSPTPTKTLRPTPSPFPNNSAALDRSEIYGSLARGAFVIVGLFILVALLMRVRRY